MVSGEEINMAFKMLSPRRIYETRTFTSDQMVYSHNTPFNFFTNDYHVPSEFPLNFRKFAESLPLLMEALITPRKEVSFSFDSFYHRNF